MPPEPFPGLLSPDEELLPPWLRQDPRAAALMATLQRGDNTPVAPIWDPNNPVGTETLQSMGMPKPTTHAGLLGQYIDPATGQMTTQGVARVNDNPALGFDTGGLLGVMKAYHGSPHLFPPTERNPLGEFDPAKIGTGEGAQRYGVGAGYLGEAEATAKEYRDKLSGANRTPGAPSGKSGFAVKGEYPPEGMSGHTAMDSAMDLDGVLQYMHMHNTKPTDFSGYDLRPTYQQSIDYLKGQLERRIDRFRSQLGSNEPRGSADRDMASLADYYDKHVRDASPSDVTPRPAGHMYEVNVNADPEHFLHWDKPLSEQPAVRDKLIKAGFDLGDKMTASSGGKRVPWDPTGAEFYESSRLVPGNYRDPAAATAALHEAGIPGIRYLDAGSRSAGEGSHNLVVFSPETMEIIRRYGLAGLLGGGAAAAASTPGDAQAGLIP